MSFVGTFDTFTTARLAIYAAQKGLSVTGNNIANINTTGYTRQRLDQVSWKVGGSDLYQSQFDAHVGNGVMVTGVSQIRDPYLDIRYRTEASSVGYMDTKLSGLNDLATILDEVGKGEGQEEGDGVVFLQLSKLWDALRGLNADAGEETNDTLVRGEASALVSLLNTYAGQLETLEKNTANQLQKEVAAVNEILVNIRDLNASIRECEIHGDGALEMRDERNRQIDALAEYMSIDVIYGEEDIGAGIMVEKLTIRLGNANKDPSVTTDSSTLVDGIYATQLTMPKANPDYDENYVADPDNPSPDDIKQYMYLDENGNGTNDPVRALQEPDANFNITLDKLLDSKGREWKDTKVTSQVKLDPTDPANDWIGVKAVYTVSVDSTSDWVSGDKITVGGVTLRVRDDGNGDLTASEANDPAKLARALAKKMNETVETDYVIRSSGTSLIFTARKTGAIGSDGPAAAPAVLTAAGSDGSAGSVSFSTMQTTTAGRDEDTANIPANVETDDGNGTIHSTLYEKRSDGWYEINTVTSYSQITELDDNDLFGSIQALRELLTENGEFSTTDTINNVDEDAAIKRGIPYYRKSLDLLAQKLAVEFNKLNQGFVVDQNGDYRTEEGDFIDLAGVRLNKNTALTEDQQDALDALGQTLDEYLADNGAVVMEGSGNLFSIRGDLDDAVDADGKSLITAANISISQSWSNGDVHIVTTFTKPFNGLPVTTQGDNVGHMISLMDKDLVYNPQDLVGDAASTHLFEGSFHEMLSRMSAVLADDQRVTNVQLNSHYGTAIELDTGRDSVSGVDLNDEAMNMMQYQKAYTAACRLMTVIDEALERLINNTGVVGR